MKNLSISQSYLLCALNEKGKLPTLSAEIPLCLVAGGLMDLLNAGCIVIEKKKLKVTEELNKENQYLESLYLFIKKSPNITLEKLALEYGFAINSNKLKKIFEDVGESLVEKQCVTSKKGGLFGNSSCFVPNPKEVDHMVQAIRAEFLENGDLSEEIITLTSLLEKSGQIKRYFSKYEKKQLKERIEEIKKESTNQIVKEMLDSITTMIAVIAAIS